MPSDAVLPVLSFITCHLMGRRSNKGPLDKSDRWGRTERTVSLIITIKDFEKLLGSYPFAFGMPGRRLWDRFLADLWEINSLDGLNDFFETLSMTLSPKHEQRLPGEQPHDRQDQGVMLSLGSPFGLFVRRACAEFYRLQFHDVTELWKNLVRYRQPTAHYMKRKVPDFARLSFDNVLLTGEKEDWEHEGAMGLVSVVYGDMLTGDQTSTLPVTTDDIEVLLEFQIAQMQSESAL